MTREDDAILMALEEHYGRPFTISREEKKRRFRLAEVRVYALENGVRIFNATKPDATERAHPIRYPT